MLFCESFALDDQNYAHSHFEAFQHVSLQPLRKEGEEQFNELKEKGFCSRLTGYIFATIHSDLVTKLFNKEKKGICGLVLVPTSTQ